MNGEQPPMSERKQRLFSIRKDSHKADRLQKPPMVTVTLESTFLLAVPSGLRGHILSSILGGQNPATMNFAGIILSTAAR